ncbi:MAG: FmdB family zinc ribbon protein [Anaerolineaceae bacterium]
MPTYEYHCPKCKTSYDLRQGFDAETTHACENCGKGVAKRVLHAPKVFFKGSGFYVTDSKSKSSAVADSSPSTAEATGDSGSSTKSEAKTETKAEGKPQKAAAPAKSSPKTDAAAS